MIRSSQFKRHIINCAYITGLFNESYDAICKNIDAAPAVMEMWGILEAKYYARTNAINKEIRVMRSHKRQTDNEAYNEGWRKHMNGVQGRLAQIQTVLNSIISYISIIKKKINEVSTKKHVSGR